MPAPAVLTAIGSLDAAALHALEGYERTAARAGLLAALALVSDDPEMVAAYRTAAEILYEGLQQKIRSLEGRG